MSSSSLSSQFQQTLSQLQRGLRQTYQDQFINLILFGSHARGEAEPDSDIDFSHPC